MLDDNPIRSRSEDSLGSAVLADRIAKMVRERTGTAPLVLALHGPWGTGKSSVLNMVAEALADDDTLVPVRFDPWFFNDIEQLFHAFFGMVAGALAEAGKQSTAAEKVAERIRRYSNVLTPVSAVLGRKIDFGEAFKQNPEDMRREIAEGVDQLGRRVLVLIDDVDRLPPTETALVLKLVRLCSDFPRFVYLLAYDRAVVSESLAKAAAGGAAFLDKIIQVEVPLPRPASEHLQEYLFQGLRKVGEPLGLDFEGTRKQFGLPAEDARLLRVLHQGPELEGLLESLRDVKRLLNAVSATAPLVAGEVNASDFLLLETLRVHFPNDYDHLHQNRYDFATFDRSSGSFGGQRLRRRPEGDPPWPRSRIPPAGRGVDDVPGVVHDCA